MKYKQIAEKLNTNPLIVKNFLRGKERTALTSEQLLELLELHRQEFERVKGLVIAKLEQRRGVNLLLYVKQKEAMSNKDIEDAYNKGYHKGAQDAADDIFDLL